MTNLDKLVEQLEDCTDDGIPCKICPVYQECLALWDMRVTVPNKVGNLALFHYSTKFKALQERKKVLIWQRLVFSGKP